MKTTIMISGEMKPILKEFVLVRKYRGKQRGQASKLEIMEN